MTLQSANAGKPQATNDRRGERQKHKLLIFEREFFSLAGTWLACRLKLMGGVIEGDLHHGTEEWHLLGMLDYACEMELLIEEVRG